MFVVLTLIIGLAALNTGANLLYLILSMMLCLLLLSGFVSSLTLMGIRIKRVAPKQAIANQAFQARMEIINKKRLFSSYSLTFSDISTDQKIYGSGYAFHIPRRKTQSVMYKMLFPVRGLYQLERIRIGSRFPFGFFERALDFQEPHHIIVYPEMVDVHSLVRDRSIESGDVESARKGIGTSLYGLREYTPEDSARWIHWKVSARARKIMVREFEKEEKKRVTIILNNYVADRDTYADYLSNNFEKSIILTASFARYLLVRDYNVQILTASGKIPFGNSVTHLHRILRALALLQLTGEQPRIPLTITQGEADSAILYMHFTNDSLPTAMYHNAEIIDARSIDLKNLTHMAHIRNSNPEQD